MKGDNMTIDRVIDLATFIMTVIILILLTVDTKGGRKNG